MAASDVDDLLNSAPCGFLSFTDEGILEVINDTLLGVLGYARDELLGRHVEGLLTLASRIFYQTHFFPLLRLHGKAEEIFLSLRSKDNESVPMLVNAVRRENEEGVVNHCAFIPVRERRKYEDEILKAKRAAEEALRSNEELTRAKQELEQHARELDRRISRLEQKNQELTRVSGILAHDLREPIRKMSMFAGLFTPQDREVLSATGIRSVERIKAESQRMDQLVTALQQFVSLDVTDDPLEDVALGKAVDCALQRVSEVAGLEVAKVRSEPLPILQGRRRQLVLLFFHLLDNAVKFRKPGESPRIDITCRVIQHNSFRATQGKYNYTDFAKIVVADDGVGFDNRYADYVFEALRKLEPNSPGLGFGLAICRKVVEGHHGSISVESEPGKGARFTLLLPLRQ